MRQALAAALCALALVCGSARAATVTLDWDANAEADLAGYRVYYATNSLLSATTAQAAANTAVTKVTLAGAATTYALSLSYGATYFFRLTAYDASSNESAFNVSSTTLLDVEASTRTPSAPPPDVSSPTAPTGLAASNVSTAAFTLGWTAATDNVGVTGYRLDVSTMSGFTVLLAGYNNRDLGSVTSAAITGLSAATTHYARLRAYDAAGNTSANSVTASTMTLTPPDTTNPSAPANPVLSGATTSALSLSWTAATDNVGVTGYQLDVSTMAAFSVLLTGYSNKDLGNVTSAVVSGLASGTTHYARLRAYDAAGNVSVNSVAASAMTLMPLSSPDTTAPSAPSNPVLSGATTSTLSLSWTAATDNVGVTGYRLDVSTLAGFTVLLAGYNNKDLGSVTSAAITGLSAATTHYARLRAYDAAGNISANSATASTTTLTPPDTTNPSAPANPVLSGATTSALSLSWTAAADNVGVTGYRLDVSISAGFTVLLAGYNNKDLGSVTSTAITGLSAATTHYVRLRAYDAAGNVSVNSVTTSTTTLTPPDTTNPSAPASPVLSGATTSTLSLSWTASTDNVGVTGYRLDVSTVAGFTVLLAGYNNKDLGSVTGAAITGLSAGTTHYVRLRAYDAAGNTSANSATASARTSSAALLIEPGGQAGWGTGTVNAALDDVKVRVRVVSGGAAVVSAKLFYEEVGGGASRQIVMSLSTSVAQSYEAVLPSTHTALKAGWMRLRAELTNADGGVAQSSWDLRVAPEARSAPDASARVQLPQRSGAGLPSSADFGSLPAASRPGVVDMRLLAAAEAPRVSGEREIDASGSSYPTVVYEIKADDRASSVFPAPVQLALAYPDADGDGLVDGTATRAARLRAFWHDGIHWRLVGGTVDETSRLVRVPTMHFSSFALFPASAQALAGAGAEVKAAERFLTPVPQDGFNDVATFGLGAREVEIFDMSGRSVFRATGGGTEAIVWTGRDGSGRVVGSGAYVARIGDFSGGKQYQVIVVVK